MIGELIGMVVCSIVYTNTVFLEPATTRLYKEGLQFETNIEVNLKQFFKSFILEKRKSGIYGNCQCIFLNLKEFTC